MRLRTFGALSISSDRQSTEDPRIQRSQLALLAVLATEGSAGVSRDRLLALFWPGSDSDTARHALGQTLYRARRALGADVIVEGPAALQLNAAVLSSDVAELVAALEKGDLAAAVALYTGPFLDGVFLAEAPEFERWVQGRRSYFASAFGQALTKLAAAASAAGDFALAVRYLRRAAANDPLSGKVAHALMLALSAAGDRSSALDAGRVYASLVHDELDAVADTAVRNLMEQLRAGSVRMAPAVPPAVSGAPAAPAPAAAPTAPALHRLATALAGRYVIVRELASGGMATVYQARDVKHERDVALKVLRPDLAVVLGAERFLNEIRITARLDHPHILTLIDSGAIDGILFYVMPYVRGHSLRDQLKREKQLGIETAIRVATQVASALDYAHEQGVIHRDIKPENILIQEGEAMLTDFGIALAVREAGGARLTEAGLSLGTPQYMSPEQAMGDRALDARSDVYSLGAVVYEMLAGEPPHSGATAQVIIAKLLAERPTSLCKIRQTVPQAVDSAVAKALAKVPADRYESAGDFASAVAAGARVLHGGARSRTRTAVMATLGLAAAALLGVWIARSTRGSRAAPGVALRDPLQLTYTGQIRSPAISADGRYIAFVTTNCVAAGCTYSVEQQEVGGSVTRRVIDGATVINTIEWSPDGRNLLVAAAIRGRGGVYLVSTLGGTPRFITPGGADFFKAGDSLLITRVTLPDTVFWGFVAGLDGVTRDSIRVTGPGDGLEGAAEIPGTSWLLAAIRHGPSVELRVMDRSGVERDRRTMPWPPDPLRIRASTDAIWIPLPKNDDNCDLVRIPFDAKTGHLSAAMDTVYSGAITDFDVTADGGRLVLDEGTSDYDLWALDFRDALRGAFAPSRRLVHSSSLLLGGISPDGARVLVDRWLGTRSGGEVKFSILPFAGGTELPLAVEANASTSTWVDSVTIGVGEEESRHVRYSLMDVRTGARRETLTLPDTSVKGFIPLPRGGYAWLTAGVESLKVQRRGDASPRVYAKPGWYENLWWLNASHDGQRLAVWGKSVAGDSMAVTVLSLPDGAAVRWWATAATEGVEAAWLPDGSMFVTEKSTETQSFYRVRGPGRAELLGTIPRRVQNVQVSDDLKRAVVVVRDYHGDAWMRRVVRPQ